MSAGQALHVALLDLHLKKKSIAPGYCVTKFSS